MARLVLLLLLPLVLAAAGAGAGLLADDGGWWPSAAGAAAGALLGLLAGWVLRRRGRHLRDAADAAGITGLTPVAHVPPAGRGEQDRRRQEEAFRMLRAALRLHEGGTARPLAVTSAAPGEGKTTVVAGLGRALARAGRPVVVVEADLRRPGLATLLGVPTAPQGLTAALVGGVPVADLLVEVEPGLRLVPAGALPPNAPELLGSEDGARVLDELAALDALVLLDVAPLLPVADTRELLAHGRLGTIVLVARPGAIGRDELARAAALLPADAEPVLVISGRPATPRSYDRYLRHSEA